MPEPAPPARESDSGADGAAVPGGAPGSRDATLDTSSTRRGTRNRPAAMPSTAPADPPKTAMEDTIHTDPTSAADPASSTARPASTAPAEMPAGPAGTAGDVGGSAGRGGRASGAAGSSPTRFADLGLPPVLVQALRRGGMDTAFPIQAAVIPDILAGRDVLGRAATGSGKTLAFGLPMLVRLFGAPSAPKRPRGLILAPTRELAIQIEAALDEPALSLGLRLATAVGGLPIKKQEERLARGVDVVIATPGRLTDLLGRKAVQLADIRVVTVDEADHMAELGFLPQLTALLNKVPEDAQQLLFSATLDESIDGLVQKYLREPATHAIGATTAKTAPAGTNSAAFGTNSTLGANSTAQHPGPTTPGTPATGTGAAPRGEASALLGAGSPGTSAAEAGTGSTAAATDSSAVGATATGGTVGGGFGRVAAGPDIAHYALHVRRPDKRAVVSEIAARPGRTLLFVRTQHGADKLARKLREIGIGAVALHGGKAQNQRTRMLAAFADGTAPVLVATDVAARGLHIDDVSLVVHVDPPADPKDYLHRTGRTARAGASGTVVTIVTPDDREEAARLAERASVTLTDVEVRPGDRRLVEITGARRPSGRPIADPSAPPTPERKADKEQPRFRQQRPQGESRTHNKKRKPGAARRSSR
ncbi:DEAD/DEAH box helicase [Nocardia sp. NPDC005746]|uniref:DEAD/DEAH box helicase n=1 Tax=Nocardia sp. NPDC005746 TaxID=3157062 RepID=UPI0033D9D7CA